AKEPAFVAWITQLNITYTPLQVMSKVGGGGGGGGGSPGGSNSTDSTNGTTPSGGAGGGGSSISTDTLGSPKPTGSGGSSNSTGSSGGGGSSNGTSSSNGTTGGSTGTMATGTTVQPDLTTFAGDPAVNGTVFIAITDVDLFLTPFNLSLIDAHVVAGPALYLAG
ncbi:hypothetical protein FQN49_009003, partial [Arthroderma sp. PD_2]